MLSFFSKILESIRAETILNYIADRKAKDLESISFRKTLVEHSILSWRFSSTGFGYKHFKFNESKRCIVPSNSRYGFKRIEFRKLYQMLLSID